MTLEEKFNEYAENPANIDLENTIRQKNGVPIILCIAVDEAILICKEEIEDACRKARLEEHKNTVLYWKTLPQNEVYGVDYHINRIRELSSPEVKEK